MKIGILRTGHSPDGMIDSHGNYDTMFERLLEGHDFTFETFSVVDGEFPAGPQDADGWLITGSKHGAYEDHAWISPLEDLIRAIHAADKPLIGVCFGHQIIAQALGGKVEKFAGGWSVGRTDYTLDGAPIALNAWHQDQVVVLPQSARVVGQSDFLRQRHARVRRQHLDRSAASRVRRGFHRRADQDARQGCRARWRNWPPPPPP